MCYVSGLAFHSSLNLIIMEVGSKEKSQTKNIFFFVI
jgi:hypothetical protein